MKMHIEDATEYALQELSCYFDSYCNDCNWIGYAHELDHEDPGCPNCNGHIGSSEPTKNENCDIDDRLITDVVMAIIGAVHMINARSEADWFCNYAGHVNWISVHSSADEDRMHRHLFTDAERFDPEEARDWLIELVEDYKAVS
jgi:hypothetical protein